MKEQKPLRVACYIRVGTKEQLGEYRAKENAYSTQEAVAVVEDTVKDDDDEHIVQQTMEITY